MILNYSEESYYGGRRQWQWQEAVAVAGGSGSGRRQYKKYGL